MRIKLISKGKRFFAPALAAILALALVFISCTEYKEIEFFTADERAVIMARGSSSSSDISSSSESSSSSAPILLQCGSGTYNSGTHFCFGGNTITELCGGKTYSVYQFCGGGKVYDYCNGAAYNSAEYICCDNKQEDIKKYGCCDNSRYTLATHFCHTDGDTYSCGDLPLNPATQFCHTDGKAYSCGDLPLNPATHYCHTDGKAYSCGDLPYDPATHHCHTDGKAYSCGGLPLNPATQFCFSDGIYSKCGGNDYDPPRQFCYKGGKVGDYCGDRTEVFDPDEYKCIEYDKIYLRTPVSYEGENYEAVLLGEQTWLARNLNYAKTGSKCGNGSSLSDGNTSTCNTYGRLYNWATAMNIEAKYNEQSWSGSDEKHQGICPSGWHIPSDAEWTTLTNYVESNSGCSNCAGTHLKSANGWNSYSGISNLDTYGFSALPGGYGDSGFRTVGAYGFWWSSSDKSSYDAYRWYMGYNYEYVNRSYNDRSDLHSVRCVRD